MTSPIQTPEDMPHVLGVSIPHMPQQHLSFPTRAAAVQAAREAHQRGLIEYTDAQGLWMLMETAGAVYIVISEVAMKQRIAQAQTNNGRILQAQGLPFQPGGH